MSYFIQVKDNGDVVLLKDENEWSPIVGTIENGGQISQYMCRYFWPENKNEKENMSIYISQGILIKGIYSDKLLKRLTVTLDKLGSLKATETFFAQNSLNIVNDHFPWEDAHDNISRR